MFGTSRIAGKTVVRRRFQLFLIKPSQYDDAGYVIQWVYSLMPSNSLAVIYSLALDAARHHILGPDTAIDITVLDEANARLSIGRICKRLRRHDGFGMVCLVGVQSNQYPRAIDISGRLRAEDVQVVIGGFHVSGVLAMLPDIGPDLQAALNMGVSLFAGEAEGRFAELMVDAANRDLKSIYNYVADLVTLESCPRPILPRQNIKRTLNVYSSFDAGRGCPYQCSFCTIITVQGRKSRARSVDDVEAILREHWAQGIKHLFITDDNLARNVNWEAIFDRIIELRERDGISMKFIIQVDALCHKIPRFIEKAARAGVRTVFVGLENINPENLLAANKRQNKISEYRKLFLEWKKAGVVTTAGYILGFPADTPESIRESIEIIKQEIPVDILEFFCLMPLPGSADHKAMSLRQEWMDPDLNRYDGEHVVTRHGRMSSEQWAGAYQTAWKTYYTRDHMFTVLRRARAVGMKLPWLVEMLIYFSTSVACEDVHPTKSGLLRRKYRADRRPSFRREPLWTFYAKYAVHTASSVARMVGAGIYLSSLALRVFFDPRGKRYLDQALIPAVDEEMDSLQLFTHSETARAAVAHARKIAVLTRG
jgi:radical SAM superfamily enzyme YgiQ (UPF0313 family)